MRRFLLAVFFLLASFARASAQDQVIGPTNLTSTTCPGTGCAQLNLAGAGSGTIQISGTFVATVQFEATTDGTNWFAVSTFPASGGSVTATTGPGSWLVGVAGYRAVRVRVSSYTSGTVVSTVRVASATQVATVNGTVIATQSNGLNLRVAGTGSLGQGVSVSTVPCIDCQTVDAQKVTSAGPVTTYAPVGGGNDSITTSSYTRTWTGFTGPRVLVQITGTFVGANLSFWYAKPGGATQDDEPLLMQRLDTGVISATTGAISSAVAGGPSPLLWYEGYLPAGSGQWVKITSTALTSGTVSYQISTDSLPSHTIPSPISLSASTTFGSTLPSTGLAIGALGTVGELRALSTDTNGNLNVNVTNIGVAVSPAFGSTFDISAASLPLPSGASTSAKQPAIGVAGTPSTDVITVQGIASMTALKVDGSAVTQPVSGTVTTTPPSNASTNVAQLAGTATDTNSGAKSNGTLRVVLATDQPALTNALKVDGSAVTQPVSGPLTDTQLRATPVPVSGSITASGTVTANQGAAAATTSGWPITSGIVAQASGTVNGGGASCLVLNGVEGMGSVFMTATANGGGASTFTLEVSLDGVTYVPVPFYTRDAVSSTSGWNLALTTAGFNNLQLGIAEAGQAIVNLPGGVTSVRARRTDPNGGSNTVILAASAKPYIFHRTVVDQGSGVNAINAWSMKVTDGTNTAAVKAASISPVATDPALVVALSPNTSAVNVAGVDPSGTAQALRVDPSGVPIIQTARPLAWPFRCNAVRRTNCQ